MQNVNNKPILARRLPDKNHNDRFQYRHAMQLLLNDDN